MRQQPEPLPVGPSPSDRANWVWLVPAALVLMALLVHARWPVAIGIGLAAGLSLSGSV